MSYKFSGLKPTWALSLSLLMSGLAMATSDVSMQELEGLCESGDATSCLDAGTAYSRGELYGKKVKKDRKKSGSLIRHGLRLGEDECRRGDYKQCYSVGVLYFEGEVVTADFPRGLELLQRSCSGGYQEACTWLENSGIHFTIE